MLAYRKWKLKRGPRPVYTMDSPAKSTEAIGSDVSTDAAINELMEKGQLLQTTLEQIEQRSKSRSKALAKKIPQRLTAIQKKNIQPKSSNNNNDQQEEVAIATVNCMNKRSIAATDIIYNSNVTKRRYLGSSYINDKNEEQRIELERLRCDTDSRIEAMRIEATERAAILHIESELRIEKEKAKAKAEQAKAEAEQELYYAKLREVQQKTKAQSMLLEMELLVEAQQAKLKIERRAALLLEEEQREARREKHEENIIERRHKEEELRRKYASEESYEALSIAKAQMNMKLAAEQRRSEVEQEQLRNNNKFHLSKLLAKQKFKLKLVNIQQKPALAIINKKR